MREPLFYRAKNLWMERGLYKRPTLPRRTIGVKYVHGHLAHAHEPLTAAFQQAVMDQRGNCLIRSAGEAAISKVDCGGFPIDLSSAIGVMNFSDPINRLLKRHIRVPRALLARHGFLRFYSELQRRIQPLSGKSKRSGSNRSSRVDGATTLWRYRTRGIQPRDSQKGRCAMFRRVRARFVFADRRCGPGKAGKAAIPLP